MFLFQWWKPASIVRGSWTTRSKPMQTQEAFCCFWTGTAALKFSRHHPTQMLDICILICTWECKYPASVDQISGFDLLASKCKFHVMLDCADVQTALGTICKWEPCEQLPVRLTKAFPAEAFPVARLHLKWTISWVHMHSWKSGNPSATLLT